jgi:hypothetical protein
VVVVLNRKRFEPALPNVARGAVMATVAPGTRRKQLLHPPTQISVAIRSYDQVEMVGLEAITKKIYPGTRAGIGHRLHESVVITGLVEHRLAPVAPIQYVKRHASNRGTRGCWHATNVKHRRVTMSVKRYVPLYSYRTSTGHHVNKALCPPLKSDYGWVG